jgi:hypothetical protein
MTAPQFPDRDLDYNNPIDRNLYEQVEAYERTGQKPVYLIMALNGGMSSFMPNQFVGVNPDRFMANAIELYFRYPTLLLKRSIHKSYQLRQSISEKHAQFIDGQRYDGLIGVRYTPDNPDPVPSGTLPPYKIDLTKFSQFVFFDAPGYFHPFFGRLKSGLYDKGLPLGNGKESSSKATKIIWESNFKTWVEGKTVTGRWDIISDIVEWHSNLTVSRNNSTDFWTQDVGTSSVNLGKGISQL